MGISKYCEFSLSNTSLTNFTFFSPVEDIGVHVHVFLGSLDELFSPCTSALLADTLKLGTLHLVRGAGHISAVMECWQVYFCSFPLLHSFPPIFATYLASL